MELAFELPEHLPRSKNQPPQTSTAVLTALSEASSITLADTTNWVNELESAILATKKDIHDRIHQDFEGFQRQLDTSRSIQSRLATLTSNINSLGAELDHPETGVLPVMLSALRHHSDLAQRSYEAQLTSTSVQYLSQCRDKYKELSTLIEERHLPRAVTTAVELQELLDSCPPPLNKSRAIADLQNLSRQSRDSVQEQLLKALVECLSLTDVHFSVNPQYHSFTLHDIFISVPKDVLATTLTTIRKEILVRYVNRAIKDGIQLVPTSNTVLKIEPSRSSDCFPALVNLFTFIYERLLPSLPATNRSSFAASFYAGLTEAIQAEILAPSIPENIYGISGYLKRIQAAKDFEIQVIGMGFFSGAEHRIKAWGDGAQSHYEKKRRATLVDKARLIILTDNHSPIRVMLESSNEAVSEETIATEIPKEEANWDFDDDEGDKVSENRPKPKEEAPIEEPDNNEQEGEEDGWGFDDDEEMADEVDAKKDSKESHDPWGVEWDDAPTQATRPVPTESKPSFSSQSTTGQSFRTANSAPKSLLPKKVSESYMVSHAAVAVADLAGLILDEALALLNSTVFMELDFPFTPSALLLSTAPSTFDLFRAMYPVSHASELSRSRSNRLQYSNDAKYLADAAQNLRVRCDSAKVGAAGDRFDETAERLGIVGASWLEDTVDQETQKLLKLMNNAGSLSDLSYDVEFAEAESAIKRVKNELVLLSQDFAAPLTPSACYTSLGTIVDQVIDQMLKDVFAIPDISELVSERIATLCRVLHPLDTLFPELDNGVSTVASHVPLWLKFTYLSDILEGSIADISSWWDAGHLVDYEPAELSRLIEALFADTPLRATTIAKIMRASPYGTSS